MRNLWRIKVTVVRNVLLASMLCPLLAACGGPSVRGAPLPVTPALSLSEGQVLAAIGVKPPVENGSGADAAVWQDRRVAFGLTDLLAESFYESGKFRLVEEKNLPQRQVIEEVADLFGSASHPEVSQPELAGIGKRLEADLLAYGRIDSTRLSGQRIQLGPLGRYHERLHLNIEVCLYVVSTQQTLCRSGEGMAQQEGVGVIYEFRHDRPDFEKTAAGRATKQAVTSAVQALLASIRFFP
jgi:hypothetical protein